VYGQVAVVTGAGSGIGRATAHRLVRDGYRVVCADLNERSGLETVRLAGGSAVRGDVVFARADVCVEHDVDALVNVALERFGALSLMVNNAGIGGAFGRLVDTAVEDWDQTFAVLVRGVFLGTRAAAREFVRAGTGGVIVNVASLAAYSGSLAPHAYSSAKAAVLNFTRSAASELAPLGIRVVAVSPGVLATSLTTSANSAYLAALDRAQPWPEHGRADDVAGAVAYLAGPDGRFVTGTDLIIDGGLSAAGPGAEFLARLGIDPRGAAGMDHGATGRSTVVRRPPARG
jgi:NAD(P)-dependent dehydrogenase (short-subunit alcohol dehydrogenase family)